jgi:putative membrane protein
MDTRSLLPLLLILPALAVGASSADTSFYKHAAEAGMGEVELGKLAESKAADNSVKSFAAMMVKDHTQANEELKKLAASKDIKLPHGPGTANDAKKLELKAMSGDSFDKSYVSNQVKAHKDTVELLNKEISSGQDADAKAFAQKVLPTVQSHLSSIEKIADSKGIKY